MEPRNLDITGRRIPEEEMANLRQYFNGMDYLTDTMNIVNANIVDAQNEQAAHTWVQWLVNAALRSFDSNIGSIRGEEE